MTGDEEGTRGCLSNTTPRPRENVELEGGGRLLKNLLIEQST